MKITRLKYFLPEKILTNNDLGALFPSWDIAQFEKKVGIKARHIASDDETALDLGYKAAESLLQHEDKTTIDFLLFCSQSPDYFLPTSACILQDKLGLNKSIGALDFNLGCTGFIYGLSLAKGLITGKIARKVLLITAETYSKYIHPQDKTNRAIFGDGAAACIIKDSKNEDIGTFVLGTDGSGYDKLIVKNGANRNNADNKQNNHLFMAGSDIMHFTIETVPSLITRTLEKNNLSLKDIKYFIYHQANAYILNLLRKKSKIDINRLCIDMETTGNTVSSTIPIVLANLLSSGGTRPGDKILLAGFGVGLSWGATIITI